MVSRMLVGLLLVAWTATAAAAGAGPTPSGSPSTPTPTPEELAPASTRQDTGELSQEDEELIKNLDLIEHLDLLNTVDVLGAVGTPDTPEEEF